MRRKGAGPALTYTAVIDGFEAEVSRKNIKNMYIRLIPPDGRVRVSVPLSVSDAALRSFVESKAEWIRSSREALRARPAYVGYKYESGERHFLWGEEYMLEVRIAPGAAVAEAGDGVLLLTVPEGGSEERRAAVLKAWYREKLRERLPELFAKWEKIIGVHAEEIRIRDMSTRWGTCVVKKKRIWMSLALAQRPLDQVEYVVAHELTHLIEPSHNARFKALMDGFMPDWRSKRAALRGR